jgi:PAS domain S-box-containing protein
VSLLPVLALIVWACGAAWLVASFKKPLNPAAVALASLLFALVGASAGRVWFAGSAGPWGGSMAAPWIDLAASLLGLATVWQFRRTCAQRGAVLQALQDRQALFQAIIDHTPVAVFVDDLQGRLLLANPAWEKFLGVRAGEALGKPISQYLPPSLAAALQANTDRVIEAGEPVECEESYQTAAGSGTCLSLKFPLRDVSGRMYAVGGIATDISRQKQAEAANREVEERLRLALEVGRMGIWDWDIIADRAWYSDELGRLLGLPPGSNYHNRDEFVSIVHPQDREGVLRALDDAQQSGEFEAEFRVVRPDDSIRWLHALGRVHSDVNGRPIRMIGVAIDVTARRAAEESLAESERRFRYIADHVRDVFWLLDAEQGRVLYVNPAYESIWGRSTGSLFQNDPDFIQTVHPDDRPAVARAFEDHARGVATTLEYRVLRPDGSTRTVRCRSYPVEHRDGAGLVAGIVEDVTEMHHVQAVLQAREGRFRALVEHAFDGVNIFDEQLRLVYTNPSLEHVLGYSPQEVLGQDGLQFAHPDDLPMIQSLWDEVLAAPATRKNVQLRLRHRDGRWRIVEAALCNLLHDPHVQGVVVNWRDITERREAERAASAREAHLRAIVDTDPECIKVLDPSGLVLEMNPAGCKMAGATSAEQVVGRQIMELIVPEYRPRFSALHEAVCRGQPGTLELELLNLQGRRFWVETRAVPLQLNGRTLHLAVTRDISERKQAEQISRDNQARLQLINKLALGLRTSGDVQQIVLQTLQHLAAQDAQARVAYFTLDAAGALRVIGAQGPPELMDCSSFEHGLPSSPGWLRALRASEPIVVADVASDPRLATLAPMLTAAGPRALLQVPLVHSPELTGVLSLDCPGPREWRAGQVETLLEVASFLSLTLSDAQAQEERRRAQAALQQRDVLLRLLADTVEDAISLADTNRRTLYVSPSYFRLTGYHPEDIQRADFGDRVHPYDRERIEEAWRANCRGEATRTQWRCQRKDGSFLWLETVATPILSGGQVETIACCTRDVTQRQLVFEEQQRAQRDLQATLLRLQVVLDRMPIGCVLIDADFRITYWNPAAERIFGFTKEDVLGKLPYETFVPPDQRDHVEAIRQQMTAGAMDSHGQTENVTKDGRRIICEWYHTPLYDSASTFIGFLAMAQDVTRRRQVEQALVRESNFRNMVIKNAAEGLCVCHAIDEFPYVAFTVWNDRMVEITGYSMEEINRQGWYQSVYPDPDLQARAIQRMARMRDGDDLRREIWEITRRDGQRRQVSITTTRLTPTDEFVHVLALMDDVTDRLLAEQRLREKERQLAHVSRLSTLGELVAGISHELNQPLHAIANFAKACEHKLLATAPAGSHASPDVLHWMQKINTSVQHAATIIRRFRQFSKIDEPVRSTVGLAEVIHDAIDLVGFVARQSLVEVETDIQPPAAVWLLDRVHIQQVLVNLLLNAIDAVRQLPAEFRTVTIRTRQRGDELEVAVLDRGPAVRPEYVPRLFTPFFSTKPDGLGMGLAISRTIVEQHGGRISYTPRPGGGSTVAFTLPRQKRNGEP